MAIGLADVRKQGCKACRRSVIRSRHGLYSSHRAMLDGTQPGSQLKLPRTGCASPLFASGVQTRSHLDRKEPHDPILNTDRLVLLLVTSIPALVDWCAPEGSAPPGIGYGCNGESTGPVLSLSYHITGRSAANQTRLIAHTEVPSRREGLHVLDGREVSMHESV